MRSGSWRPPPTSTVNATTRRRPGPIGTPPSSVWAGSRACARPRWRCSRPTEADARSPIWNATAWPTRPTRTKRSRTISTRSGCESSTAVGTRRKRSDRAHALSSWVKRWRGSSGRIRIPSANRSRHSTVRLTSSSASSPIRSPRTCARAAPPRSTGRCETWQARTSWYEPTERPRRWCRRSATRCARWTRTFTLTSRWSRPDCRTRWRNRALWRLRRASSPLWRSSWRSSASTA